MLMGLDVTERLSDAQAAVHDCMFLIILEVDFCSNVWPASISPVFSRKATTMLVDTKNGISCVSLLSNLAAAHVNKDIFQTPLTSRTMPISMSAKSGRLPQAFYGSYRKLIAR
jgi:hypothetical protein